MNQGRLTERLLATVYTLIYHAVLLLVNVWILFTVTLAATLLARQAILPEYEARETPLNFVFKTCENELSGVCSFPTAEVQLYDR